LICFITLSIVEKWKKDNCNKNNLLNDKIYKNKYEISGNRWWKRFDENIIIIYIFFFVFWLINIKEKKYKNKGSLKY
jgi:hypothetical protein